MDSKQLKRILLLPLILLVIVAGFSLFFQSKRSSELDNTYWTRVNYWEDPSEKINPAKYSVRKIEIKSFSVVSTLVFVGEKSKKSGFKKGDLDFYGTFNGEEISGMTHYRGQEVNCSIDIYSPTQLRLSKNKSIIEGSDLLPFFEPVYCRPWPRDQWEARNFTLYRIEFKE
jgi:hypothetical protein